MCASAAVSEEKLESGEPRAGGAGEGLESGSGGTSCAERVFGLDTLHKLRTIRWAGLSTRTEH